MKWYRFDPAKGSRQKRPPEKKWVLVQVRHPDPLQANPIVAGYMKNAAGDKQSPYFVTPGLMLQGLHGPNVVIAWCDCLPENFEYLRS